jgi:hypothetical protein
MSLRHLVRPACLELALLDPRVARELGIVAAPPHLNDLAFFVTTCPPRRDVTLC